MEEFNVDSKAEHLA